mgnify:FL=1
MGQNNFFTTQKKMKQTKERNIHNETQDIIRQVKEGEQKAQFQLYKYYFNTMFKTSLEIVKDEGKAEDVLNEGFLKAFDKIETYDIQDNFGNWLENIIVYQSKNKLKEEQKVTNSDHSTKRKNKKQNLLSLVKNFLGMKE